MAINYNEEQFGLQLPNTNQGGITDVAFTEGSALDQQINKLNTLEQMGFPQPNLQNLKEMDMKQFKEKGIPLSLPADQYAMAISNYDQLFGPKTMTDAFGTIRNVEGLNKPDLYTGMIDQSGNPIMDDIDMQYTDESFNVQPQYRIRDQLKRDFLQGVDKMQEGLGFFRDKAGQGWDFAQQLPGMAMSALTGIPFLGQILGAIGNQFEDRQLTGDVMDEYGNMYSAEDLNKMNAKGGWYTDPARSARRRTNRIAKMRQRLEDDKKISHKNLHELVRQEKAQQLRDAQNAADRANIQNIQNYTGRELSGYRMSRPASERNYTGAGKSGMGRDNPYYAHGGRVRFANGGLASLFTRRG